MIRYSRNPKTGIVECYSEKGDYLGNIYSQGDPISGARKKRTIDRHFMGRMLKKPEQDEEVWRTSEETGKHFKIETETGEIKAGFGGKLNGVKADPSKRKEPQTVGSKPVASKPVENKPASGEWRTKFQSERDNLLKQSQANQALFVYEAGFASEEEAVDAMHAGKASDLVNKYFDILEENGDTKPTKPLVPQMARQLEQDVKSGKYADYDEARTAYIMNLTGQPESEAKETLNQMETWFCGSWDKADRATLDRYIDQDGVAEGTIYRGLKFTPDGYEKFMAQCKVGAKIRMRGNNSSWTTDKSNAVLFSGGTTQYQGGEAVQRSVRLKCLKNRTSAPVDHLSIHGEGEVLAHSRAQWTVLNVEEGSAYTEITVIEAGEFAPEIEGTWDSAPRVRDSALSAKYEPLAKRMAAQSKLFEVVPESLKFAEELEKKYGGKR